jgi:SP family general alpha glucoside:H+ symporter-like MFS transporter
VFDIACALADVLPFISSSASYPGDSPVDCLTHMVSLLVQLPGGTSKFAPLLMAKIHELLPDLAQKLCEATGMPSITLNNPMSPDTRFAYEEEVGRGLYTDLRR